MRLPIVSVDNVGKKAVIFVGVPGLEPDRQFPLTRKGAAAAGEYLHEIGADEWLYSSSCHHPDDYKPRCRLNVCSLVTNGYNLVWARSQK